LTETETPAVPTDAEAPEPDPLTSEQIDAKMTEGAWATDVQAVTQQLSAEFAEISKLKIAARLLPAGGIQMHLNQIRDQLAQHNARVRILRDAWLELQLREPLPQPSKLDVAGDGGLVVPKPVVEG
jgi:hypothetical protein